MKRLIALVLFAHAGTAYAAERKFAIEGQAFSEAEIVDARAQPELDGTTSVRITFNAAAGKRIATLTRGLVGKPAHVALDGASVADPVVREPIEDGVLMISGTWSLEGATALAKKISGKDPLPESLEE